MEAGNTDEAGKCVVLKAVNTVTACLYACCVPSVRAALSRRNITGAKVEFPVGSGLVASEARAPPGALRTPESETDGQQ